jgi:hypothetical protein
MVRNSAGSIGRFIVVKAIKLVNWAGLGVRHLRSVIAAMTENVLEIPSGPMGCTPCVCAIEKKNIFYAYSKRGKDKRNRNTLDRCPALRCGLSVLTSVWIMYNTRLVSYVRCA